MPQHAVRYAAEGRNVLLVTYDAKQQDQVRRSTFRALMEADILDAQQRIRVLHRGSRFSGHTRNAVFLVDPRAWAHCADALLSARGFVS